MDTKNKLKKEENIEKLDDSEIEDVSLDDMMAASVDNSVEPKAEGAKPEAEVAKPIIAVIEPKEIIEIANEQTETPVIANPEPARSELAESAEEEAISEPKTTVSEEKEETVPVASPSPKKVVYRGKWYIVHTYSGHENKVAKTLMQRVQAMGFENRIFDALVPTRDTIRVRGGKKETIKEKIFPGYILVNMELSDEAWVLVRTTPGVTSFVGAQNKPTPIRDDEVQAIVAFVEQKEPIYRAQFSMGEAVKITDGPFSDFLGTVESIDDGKGKVKVLVSIFGRETPVELDFLQVAKI